MKSNVLSRGLTISVVSLLSACTNLYSEQHEYFVPGLGEIMTQSELRHAKLWFAGQAKNWELAAYEVDELHEGFEDAGKYHPTHKQISQPIPDLIANTMQQPLARLEQAIKDKNLQAFSENYDKLTDACNVCHQSTGFGFNIVTRPAFNPFANQTFGVKN